MQDQWFGRGDKRYVEFIAHDFRNARLAKISTDPSATTNYFEAKNNALPFELSPAFFRPEVLLKYKTDRDKYTVGERDVQCRAAWYLKGIDVNEAGQVHAYICYLRNLPYSEQLHWASFNEEPKSRNLAAPLPTISRVNSRHFPRRCRKWRPSSGVGMKRVPHGGRCAMTCSWSACTRLTASRDESAKHSWIWRSS